MTPAALPRVDRLELDNGMRVYVLEQRGFPLVSIRYVFGSATLEDGVEAHRALASFIKATPALEGFTSSVSSKSIWLGTDVRPAAVDDRLSALATSVAKLRLEYSFRANGSRTWNVNNAEESAIFAAMRAAVPSPPRPNPDGLKDCQERLEARMAPGASALVIAGDVHRDQIEVLVRRAFGAFGRPPRPPAPPAQSVAPQASPAIRLMDVRMAEAIVALATPAPELGSADSAAFALLVYAALLSPSSFLRRSLRSDSPALFDRTPSSSTDGVLSLSFFVDVGGVAVMTQRIFDTLDHAREAEPSPEDLEAAKAVLVERLAAALETPSAAANTIARAIARGVEPESWADLVASISRVTADDVRRVAQKYWTPSHRAIVIAGPERELRAHLRLADIQVGALSD